MSNLVTISQERLENIAKNAHLFSTDPAFESDIIDLIQAKKAVEEAMKIVQASFKELFATGKMENSIDGDVLRVTVSQAGSIFKSEDLTKIDPSLLKLQLDSSSVQRFVDENDKLPDGVEYNQTRSLAVRMSLKKGAHD